MSVCSVLIWSGLVCQDEVGVVIKIESVNSTVAFKTGEESTFPTSQLNTIDRVANIIFDLLLTYLS